MPDQKQQDRWYNKTYTLIAAFLCVGPFALPLLWKNPRFRQKTKIAVSIIIFILTYFLILFFINSLKSINKYYQEMYNTLNKL